MEENQKISYQTKFVLRGMFEKIADEYSKDPTIEQKQRECCLHQTKQQVKVVHQGRPLQLETRSSTLS